MQTCRGRTDSAVITGGEGRAGQGRAAQGSVFMIHGSRFGVQDSRFTIRSSRFTIRSSRFTIRSSRFTVHYSQFTVQGSQFAERERGGKEGGRLEREIEIGRERHTHRHRGEKGRGRTRGERDIGGREGAQEQAASVGTKALGWRGWEVRYAVGRGWDGRGGYHCSQHEI